MKKSLFIPFLIFFAIPLQAIITGAQTYVDPKTNQLVTLIHTIHLDYLDQEITKKEQDALLKTAHAFNAALAAEDLGFYEGTNTEMIRYLDDMRNGKFQALLAGIMKINIKNTNKGLQPAFTRDCAFDLLARAQKAKIPSYNLECRHLKDASSVPGYAISGKAVWKNFRKEMENSLTFTDDRAFLHYPTKICKLLNANESLIAQMRIKENSLFDLTLKSQNMGFFGSELVDVRMGHALDLFKDHKHLFLVAGTDHCKNMNGILQELGYKSVHSSLLSTQDTGPIELVTENLDINAYFSALTEMLEKQSAAKV